MLTDQVGWMKDRLGARYSLHTDQDIRMTICDRECTTSFSHCKIFMGDDKRMRVDFYIHAFKLQPPLSDFKVYISHIDRICDEGKASVDVLISSGIPVTFKDLIPEHYYEQPAITVITQWNGTSEEYRNLFVKYLGFPDNE